MEVDRSELVASVFNEMLKAGLCAETDRPYAQELYNEWTTYYNQTFNQQGEYYNHEESYYATQVRSLCAV